MVEYRNALDIEPGNSEAHSNLGAACLKEGRVDEAIAECLAALDLKRDYAEAHFNLGNAYLRKGRVKETVAEYRQALGINPTLGRQGHPAKGEGNKNHGTSGAGRPFD